MKDFNLIIILGPTASGKTKLAAHVANVINGEIISADSRQVFKKMDIGTGKDLDEYTIQNSKIPYHLIDILEPGERYHVDAFKNDFYRVFGDITARGRVPVLCGGTGMYIHSLLQSQEYTAVPVNESLRAKLQLETKEELTSRLKEYNDVDYVDLNSKKRLIRGIEVATFLAHNDITINKGPKINPVVFGLKNEVEITRAKILKRLDDRLSSGMIDEVENLISGGVSKDMLVFYGLEYKFMVNFLNGLMDYDEFKMRLGIAICQYAKRQNTFFRKMEKDGVLINWLDASLNTNQITKQILAKISF